MTDRKPVRARMGCDSYSAIASVYVEWADGWDFFAPRIGVRGLPADR